MKKEGKAAVNFAVEVALTGVPVALWYLLPPEFENAGIGDEVAVEVSNRVSSGWITAKKRLPDALADLKALFELKNKAAGKREANLPASQLTLLEAVPREERSILRSLKPVLNTVPVFRPEQFELFQWMAQYYGAPLAEVIDTALPSHRGAAEKPVRKRALKKKEEEPAIFSTPEPERLTDGQAKALTQISESLSPKRFAPILLFGVTGSGKTEVYLQAIKQVLSKGGTALVIVPEISLTPQLIDRFQTRLGIPLALLHSQVSPAEKWDTWQRILRGELRVCLGARSAIFAPLENLALLVVDEEHDSSFKQSDNLRYHARDVAVMRAKFSSAAIVLGSATPSFESLANVMRKNYALAELPERATEKPLPLIEIVDLSKIKKKDMPAENVSPQLHAALQKTLEEKGQAIILYNRRGFSSYLQCGSCNEVVTCPHCSVALTFHKKRNRLLCHYCDLAVPVYQHCRFCRDPRTSRLACDLDGKPLVEEEAAEQTGLLIQRGSGTERVVEELERLFPGAKIIRMDRDTVNSKDSYRTILGSMKLGQADILVGTQMIAKGHDLPGVTLVGIINADVGLHLPDFRSSERVYQLITQAAGRAGRGSEPGRVLVQTLQANHPTIVATATGRFKAFARYELEFRKRLNYPPAGRLLRVIVSSPDDSHARQEAHRIAGRLRAASQPEGAELQVLGPAPAPHERLRGRYRHHIMVKSGSARAISALAAEIGKNSTSPEGDVRVAIDVDPVDML